MARGWGGLGFFLFSGWKEAKLAQNLYVTMQLLPQVGDVFGDQMIGGYPEGIK